MHVQSVLKYCLSLSNMQICGVFVAVVVVVALTIYSLIKDFGNGKANPRKQWSDWLNEEK